jgi:hypothetical protein
MEQKYYWIFSLITIIVILIIISIRQDSSTSKEKLFSNVIKGVNLEASYTINIFSSHASSGGGIELNETREINSTFLKETINEIKNMKVAGSFLIGNMNCFYTGSQSTDYFSCFADDKIVNYVRKDGPDYLQWNVIGYEFNISRSDIILSINDIKKCNFDSDCTLTSFGVCDPTKVCAKISADCDPGCRTSINKEHYLIWDFVPLIEDQCITDKCANYEQNEYFKAFCVNNVCEAKIIKK